MTEDSRRQLDAIVSLTPCPFCGDQAETGLMGDSFYVGCQSCGATMICQESEDKAIQNWDRRPREMELENTLALILEASAPYLKRRKMTPRSCCDFLNKAYCISEKILAG